jgi:hypothetical protein
MNVPEEGNHRKRGRPRGGVQGTRVRDYPALLVRLRPEIHDIALAIAQVKNWSQAQVITEALVFYRLSYLRSQEESTSRQVDELLASRRRPARQEKRLRHAEESSDVDL